MGTCILNGHPSILADSVISNYARTDEEADGSHVVDQARRLLPQVEGRFEKLGREAARWKGGT